MNKIEDKGWTAGMSIWIFYACLLSMSERLNQKKPNENWFELWKSIFDSFVWYANINFDHSETNSSLIAI